jgi:hypothetical protein
MSSLSQPCSFAHRLLNVEKPISRVGSDTVIAYYSVWAPKTSMPHPCLQQFGTIFSHVNSLTARRLPCLPNKYQKEQSTANICSQLLTKLYQNGWCFACWAGSRESTMAWESHWDLERFRVRRNTVGALWA